MCNVGQLCLHLVIEPKDQGFTHVILKSPDMFSFLEFVRTVKLETVTLLDQQLLGFAVIE